jgi:hypothetical protein
MNLDRPLPTLAMEVIVLHKVLAATVLGTLALSTSLASAQARIQTPVVRTPVTQACPNCLTPFPTRDTTNGAGNGLITVYVGNSSGSALLYLGTAASLSWSTNNGNSNVPIERAPGTVIIYFAQNNSLHLSAYPQSCFQTGTCPAGTTITLTQFQLNAPPSYTTFMLVAPAPVYGGSLLAVPYQTLYMGGRVM